MKKKTITIGLICLFLLTCSASAIDLKKSNLETNDDSFFRICAGKFISDGDANFIYDNNFEGKDLVLPHGKNLVIYIDYEIIDTLVPDEYWCLEMDVIVGGSSIPFSNDEFDYIELWDYWGDDSKTGTLEVTYSNENLRKCKQINHFYIIFDGHYENCLPDGYWDYIRVDPSSDKLIMENNAPSKPTIEGPSILRTGATGTFMAISNDTDDDRIEYGWDWNNDEEVDVWTSEHLSGQPCYQSKMWEEKDTYIIRVKARDTYLKYNKLESEWSDSFSISMPKNRLSFNNLFEKLITHFPLLSQILA